MTSDLKAAPYAADTRARGWRFELDLERVRQSDTWALATPEIRPWLLLLWATAWEQVPCGSLPNDDALIAARIGMAPKSFAKARPVLMRGWAEADDGRLYHATIAERVLEMINTKRRESERKAAYRERMEAERARLAANVPRDNLGTTAGRAPDATPDATPTETGTDPGRDATGTGTRTGTRTREYKENGGIPPEPPARRRARPDPAHDPLPPWVDATAWDGFEGMRRAIRKPLTPAARRLAVAELARLRDAGHDPTEVLRQSTFRSWAGLFPLKQDAPPTNGGGHHAVTAMSPHGMQTMLNAKALKARLLERQGEANAD